MEFGQLLLKTIWVIFQLDAVYNYIGMNRRFSGEWVALLMAFKKDMLALGREETMELCY